MKVFVTEEMVGHRLGEFAATRTFRGHSGRRAKAEAGATARSGRFGRSGARLGRENMELEVSYRYAKIAPRKARLVVDLIRGASVDEALNTLRLTRKRTSAMVDQAAQVRRRDRVGTVRLGAGRPDGVEGLGGPGPDAQGVVRPASRHGRPHAFPHEPHSPGGVVARRTEEEAAKAEAKPAEA